jgi:hypothetical protein
MRGFFEKSAKVLSIDGSDFSGPECSEHSLTRMEIYRLEQQF